MSDHTKLAEAIRSANGSTYGLAEMAADALEEQITTIARLSAALERYIDLYYGAHTDAINEYSGNVRADTDAMCQSIAEDARALGVNPSCLTMTNDGDA